MYKNAHLRVNSALLGEHNYSVEKGSVCPNCDEDICDFCSDIEEQDFVGSCEAPWKCSFKGTYLAGVFRCPHCFEICWFHIPWDKEDRKYWEDEFPLE